MDMSSQFDKNTPALYGGSNTRRPPDLKPLISDYNIFFLGDGGYKLQPYLMTPYRNPVTQSEKKYNLVHARVRNTVERQYGVWKRRFPCLALGLRCKLDTSLKVIVACAVLHNICIQANDGMPTPDAATEDAISETTITVGETLERIENATPNQNRRAVQIRNIFSQQISTFELN